MLGEEGCSGAYLGSWEALAAGPGFQGSIRGQPPADTFHRLPLPPPPSPSSSSLLLPSIPAICLAPLRGSVQSLQCGHIYHARCLKDAAEVGAALRHCALCRQSNGTIRDASARAAVGSGFRAFVAPAASTRGASRAAEQLSHRPRVEEAGEAGHRAPDPRLVVLASVASSLPPLPDSQHAGADNYIFVLDISCESAGSGASWGRGAA